MAATPTQMMYPQILAVGLGGNSLDFVDIAQGALGHRVKANIAVDDLNQYFQWGRTGNSAVGTVTDLPGFQLALNCAFDDGFVDLDANAQGLSFTTGVLRNRNNITGTINDLVTAYILYSVYGSSAIDTANKYYSLTNLKTMLTDDVVSSVIGASLSQNGGSSGFVDQMFQMMISSDPVRFVRDGMIMPMNPNESSGSWMFTTGDTLQFVLKFQFNAPVTGVTLGLQHMDNIVGVANGQAPQPTTYIQAGQIFCVTLQLQATANRSARRIAQLAALASPSEPQNVTLAQTTIGGELIAAWEQPTSAGGSPVVSYTVTLTGSDNSVVVTPNIITTNITFSNLNGGLTYTVTVAATNTTTTGPNSVPSSAVSPLSLTLASVPTNLSLSQAGVDELSVSWSAPENTGGAPITSYKIYLYTLDNSNTTLPPIATQSYTSSGSGTTYLISGLSSTLSYNAQVAAITIAGEGPVDVASNMASPLASSSPTVPSGPTDVTLSQTANPGELVATWTPPTNDGGAAVTGYILYLLGLNDDAIVQNVDGGNTTTYTFTGLNNTILYRLTMSAVNSVGSGGGTPDTERISPL